jgi:hypothetical protein
MAIHHQFGNGVHSDKLCFSTGVLARGHLMVTWSPNYTANDSTADSDTCSTPSITDSTLAQCITHESIVGLVRNQYLGAVLLKYPLEHEQVQQYKRLEINVTRKRDPDNLIHSKARNLDPKQAHSKYWYPKILQGKGWYQKAQSRPFHSLHAYLLHLLNAYVVMKNLQEDSKVSCFLMLMKAKHYSMESPMTPLPLHPLAHYN